MDAPDRWKAQQRRGFQRRARAGEAVDASRRDGPRNNVTKMALTSAPLTAPSRSIVSCPLADEVAVEEDDALGLLAGSGVRPVNQRERRFVVAR